MAFQNLRTIRKLLSFLVCRILLFRALSREINIQIHNIMTFCTLFMQTWKLNYHYCFNIVFKLPDSQYDDILHFVSSVLQYDGCWFYICLINWGIYHAGQKFREVFQLKRGSYSDLPASKISEMMHSKSLDVSSTRILPKVIELCYLAIWYPVLTVVIFSQNAPTQSLISVVNGILDESIERKKGEIPHVCFFNHIASLFIADCLRQCITFTSSQRVVYLLRKVVQEIERRLCIQAEHIRSVRKSSKNIHFHLATHLGPELDILFCSKILSLRQEKRSTVQKLKHLKYW